MTRLAQPLFMSSVSGTLAGLAQPATDDGTGMRAAESQFNLQGARAAAGNTTVELTVQMIGFTLAQGAYTYLSGRASVYSVTMAVTHEEAQKTQQKPTGRAERVSV
jgi:hypothetical protein